MGGSCTATWKTTPPTLWFSKTLKIFIWLEIVHNSLEQFLFVNRDSTWKHVKYTPIYIDTIKKYKQNRTRHVEKNMAQSLQSKFSIAFGGRFLSLTSFVY